MKVVFCLFVCVREKENVRRVEMFLCSIIQTPLLGRQRGSATSNSQAVQIQQDTDIEVFFFRLLVCLFFRVFAWKRIRVSPQWEDYFGFVTYYPCFFSLFRKREQTTLAVSFQQSKGGKKQGQPASTQLNS